MLGWHHYLQAACNVLVGARGCSACSGEGEACFLLGLRPVVLQAPEERPKVVAVRRHVLWWRPQEQLGFLCSLSKFIEGRRHLKESLNARAAAVLPGE